MSLYIFFGFQQMRKLEKKYQNLFWDTMTVYFQSLSYLCYEYRAHVVSCMLYFEVIIWQVSKRQRENLNFEQTN
jgi:hypothetical protein